MNCKAKGNRNEYKSMRLLEASGYACTRAAASLGVWDIVASGSQDIILLQVKSNEWPRSVEMEAMQEFKCPPNARKLIHVWVDRQKLPKVKEVL